MALAEQFFLRWNDFHSNLTQSFQSLLKGEDLVDVTLVAGGKYVKAHKLILSVCSSYFKELFKMNPCEHPIVVLDIPHQKLEQILRFMYSGEVHILRQELSAFLHTAEMLQVKGLTTIRDTQVQHDQQRPLDLSNGSLGWIPGCEETLVTEVLAETDGLLAPSPIPSKKKKVNVPRRRKPLKSLNVKKKRSRPMKKVSHTHMESCPLDSEPPSDYDLKNVNHTILGNASNKENGCISKRGRMKGVKCPSCNRNFVNRYNMKVHIKDKHDNREWTLKCEICHKHMRNPSCLRVHMYFHRKQGEYLASTGHSTDHLRQNVQGSVKGLHSRGEKSVTKMDFQLNDDKENASGAEQNRPTQVFWGNTV